MTHDVFCIAPEREEQGLEYPGGSVSDQFAAEPPGGHARSAPRARGRWWSARRGRRSDEEVAQSPVDLVPEDLRAPCRAALRTFAGGEPRTIAVTSAVRGEGRTTVALSCALVEQEELARSTVLLELDLGRASLGPVLGLQARVGLAEVLQGEATVDEALTWITPTLGVVLAGSAGEPGRALLAFRHSGLLQQLRGAGHTVIADLPPVSPGHHGDRVVDLFDNTILVVRAGRTPMEQVRAAAQMTPQPPALLLNATSSAVPGWLRRPLGM